MRTMAGCARSLRGMKSMTTAGRSAVVKVVSSTIVSGR